MFTDKENNVRLAVLFYGQPRFINNVMTFLHNKHTIYDKYKTDFFVHTWFDKEQKSFDVSTWSNITNCYVEPNTIEIINNLYKPLVFNYEKPKNFQFNVLLKKFIDDNFYYNSKNYNNLLSHLNSIQKVSRDFNHYVNYNKIKYDFILLNRFDSFVTGVPELINLDRQKFYIPNNHSRFPDTAILFSHKFLEWSMNLFDDTQLEVNLYQDMWEPSPEAFKYLSFVKRFNKLDIQPCEIYGHFVRS